jgi:hypothetical protein
MLYLGNSGTIGLSVLIWNATEGKALTNCRKEFFFIMYYKKISQQCFTFLEFQMVRYYYFFSI